jgi:hypothetical protein
MEEEEGNGKAIISWQMREGYYAIFSFTFSNRLIPVDVIVTSAFTLACSLQWAQAKGSKVEKRFHLLSCLIFTTCTAYLP